MLVGLTGTVDLPQRVGSGRLPQVVGGGARDGGSPGDWHRALLPVATGLV